MFDFAQPTPRRKRRVSASRLAYLTSALAAALCAVATAALARETLVESFSPQNKFAPMWPGGTVDQGGDHGLPWLRVVTDGKGGGAFVTNLRPYKPALDFSGRFVKVWTKVDDVKKLSGMEFRLSSDRFAQSYFAFSSPMYDDVDFNVLRDGVWTVLTFDFGQAKVFGTPKRDAINSIGLYVADNAKAGPVTALWGGLAAVDEPDEGVVSFTFDDGFDDHITAAQLMAKYGFRGTAYIIPDAIGELNYMTLHQLVDLQDRMHWEIAAHHVTPFTDMRPDELEDSILGVQRYLIENRFERGAAHLAYPLGKQNTSFVRPLVRQHFVTARIASSGPETLPPADPHLLRVLNVTRDVTPEQVGAAAARARDYREWLILMFHQFVDSPEYATQYKLADFEKVLAEVAKTKVRVAPLIEVWEACGSYQQQGGCPVSHAIAAPAPAKLQ